ncbi:MAG: hypothetical protein DRI90_25930 [Deltaproteobacteria bacterium]|nr:MAG: hypothetical protein DRI90_25930 [Deltaproteobacteria bacterium]
MDKREFSTIVLAAALAAAVTACNSSDGPAPQVAPAPPEPVAEEAQPAQESNLPPASELEQSALVGMEAPFVLTLVTPTKVPDKAGVFEIEAQIKAPQELNAPAAISIELPKTAKLKKGEVREVLATLPGGLTTRTFEVELTEPLTDATPIKVVVDVKDPKGAFGAHAEKVYPMKPKAQKSGSSRVPKPPAGRPGG